VGFFLLLSTTFETNTDCLYVQLYRCTYLDTQRSNGANAINIKCCSNVSLLQNLIRVECKINADFSNNFNLYSSAYLKYQFIIPIKDLTICHFTYTVYIFYVL